MIINKKLRLLLCANCNNFKYINFTKIPFLSIQNRRKQIYKTELKDRMFKCKNCKKFIRYKHSDIMFQQLFSLRNSNPQLFLETRLNIIKNFAIRSFTPIQTYIRLNKIFPLHLSETEMLTNDNNVFPFRKITTEEYINDIPPFDETISFYNEFINTPIPKKGNLTPLQISEQQEQQRLDELLEQKQAEEDYIKHKIRREQLFQEYLEEQKQKVQRKEITEEPKEQTAHTEPIPIQEK